MPLTPEVEARRIDDTRDFVVTRHEGFHALNGMPGLFLRRPEELRAGLILCPLTEGEFIQVSDHDYALARAGRFELFDPRVDHRPPHKIILRPPDPYWRTGVYKGSWTIETINRIAEHAKGRWSLGIGGYDTMFGLPGRDPEPTVLTTLVAYFDLITDAVFDRLVES